MNRFTNKSLRFLTIFLILLFLLGVTFTSTAYSIDEKDQYNDLEHYLSSEQYTSENSESKTMTDKINSEDSLSQKSSDINIISPEIPNIVSISKLIVFPTPQVTVNGQYSRLNVIGLTGTGAVGDPELFSKTITMKFKPGTIIKDIEFTPNDIYFEKLTSPLRPVQEPIPVSEIYDVYSYPIPDYTPPNPAIYTSTNPFPEQWFDVNKGMGLDFESGDLTLFVNIRIYPVRYLPVQNEIMYLEDGKLQIQYEQPDRSEPIPNNIPAPKPHQKSRAAPLDDEYMLLIIGPEIFRQNLTRLAEFKNKSGLPAIFVSMNEIKSSKYFPLKGSDDQEQIKYFIYNAKLNWNITYVILGGDTPLIPHRNVYIDGGMAGNVPADLYYGDILDSNMNFCDWDSDNDEIYGEYSSGLKDNVDMFADVLVGRLPASTNDEIKVLVDKIINYESFTSGQPWFDNITMCGTDTFTSGHGDSSGIPEGEYSAEHIYNNYMENFTATKIYETTYYTRDLPCTSTNIVNTLNLGSGFATFHDHGAPNSWAGKFSSSNAASLTNGDKLPFLNFDACSTAYFDGSSDSITEVVVLNPNGGSITSIGASRIGWGQHGTGHITRFSGYFNVHLYKKYYNGAGTAGKIFEGSKYDYLRNVGINTYHDYMTVTEYTLFGDPSLSIGGIPLKNINLSCENNESLIMPSGSVQYKIKITNNGTYSRPIRIYITGVPAGWKAELNKSLVIVPSNGEKEITLFVNASEFAEFNQVANIEVYAYYSQSKDRKISIMTKTITTRTYGLDLNSTFLEDTVFPGKQASYWFRVINRGNAVDIINLTAQLIKPGPLEDWIFNFSNSKVTILPFSTQIITLKVSQPITTYHGSYKINISGKILGFSGEFSEDNFIVTLNILRTYGLEFKSEEEVSRSFNPGENFTYHFKVSNLGNYWDNFYLSLLMYPPTWNIYLRDTGHFRVEAFSEVIKELYFEVPNQTEVGKYTIKVRAQSTGNYTVLENININVRVNRSYGIDVMADVTEFSTFPGDINEINLMINHVGNDDDEVQFKVIDFPAKWYYNLTNSISINSFSEKQVKFQVTPNLKALAGIYQFQIKFILMGNLEEEQIDFEVTINKLSGFDFYSINNNYSVNAGSSQRYTLFLENVGNHEDEVNFGIINVPDYWSINWTPSNLENENEGLKLGPHSYRNDIFLKITTNPQAIADTYKLTLSGQLLSTGKTIRVDLYLTILPEFDITIELDPDDAELKVRPGEEFTISINITNKGNAEDKIERSITGMPYDWVIRGPKNYTYTMLPFECRKEVIRFEVPDDEFEREVNLSIKIRSEGDPGKDDQELAIITVEPLRGSGPEDSSNEWGDIQTMFGKNFITVILPILILIVVVIIIAFLLLKQKKEYEEDMMYASEDYGESYGMDANYKAEQERLYGPSRGVDTAVGKAGTGALRSGHRRSRSIPRPPTRPPVKADAGPGVDSEGDSMRWLDDDQEQRSKIPSSKKRISKEAKQDSMALCPTCGELVSLYVKECPYCGEVFEDVDKGVDKTDEGEMPHKRMRREQEEASEVEDWDEDEETKDDESEAEDWDKEEDEDIDEDIGEWDEEEEEIEEEIEFDKDEEEDKPDIDWE